MVPEIEGPSEIGKLGGGTDLGREMINLVLDVELVLISGMSSRWRDPEHIWTFCVLRSLPVVTLYALRPLLVLIFYVLRPLPALTFSVLRPLTKL